VLLLALLALQPSIDEAFRNVRGAAIVLDIASGRVIASHRGTVAARQFATPGSAIKPFVLAVLIQGAALPPKFEVMCDRRVNAGGRRLDCSHPEMPAAINASDALVISCNRFFASLGAQVSPRTIANGLRSYGFTVTEGTPGDQLALGEAGVRITPLGLARAYARLAKTRSDPRFAPVWTGLTGAVEAGTAQLAAIPGLAVAGKTGTTATHAWFAALAPAENPQAAVVVFTQHGRGGGTAAPIAARILGAWASEGVSGRTVNVAHRQFPLEEYVAGVLAAETSQVAETEALKATAVMARTFAVVNRGRHRGEGYDLCARTHCQLFRPKEVRERHREMASATEGELLWYMGAAAQVFYHQHCGGTTEAAHELWKGPRRGYLQSRQDTFCVARGRSPWRTTVQARDLAIVSRTASGRVRTVRVNGVLRSFDQFQDSTGSRVRSAFFNVRRQKEAFVIEGYGAGHGVGLCHTGAIERSRAGHSYRDILDFYFSGAKAGVTPQGLSWQRMSGERVELWSTQPDRDREWAVRSERAVREAESRMGRPVDVRPVVRVYPTLGAFRDATGEPGWVVASTLGRVVRVRPGGEKALLHEMLHVVMDSMARHPLPDWCVEGLACYLENPGARVAAGRVTSSGIRRPSSEPAMRKAYTAAQGRVAALVRQYGREVVLGWLESGIPAK
jgi:stage II sporulation protein D